jgi:chaperonin cofactor prefoldin
MEQLDLSYEDAMQIVSKASHLLDENSNDENFNFNCNIEISSLAKKVSSEISKWKHREPVVRLCGSILIVMKTSQRLDGKFQIVYKWKTLISSSI